MRILFPLIAIALAGSAVVADSATRDQRSDEEKLTAELAGLVPGKPTDCLDSQQSSQLKAIGGTILYEVSKNLIYRNDTGGGCENIARGDTLVTVSHTGRLCRGDIGHTVDSSSHFPTGSCGLGAFIPYRKPAG